MGRRAVGWGAGLRALAAALALAAGLALLAAYDLRRIPEYSEEPLLSLAWDAPEAVALRAGRDGRRYGPQSFAVGQDGRIAVLDSAGRRLLLFDPGGRPARPVLLDPAGAAPARAGVWPVDVAATPSGGFVVLDAGRSRLLELDAAGRVTGERQLPVPENAGGRPLAVADRVAVDRAGRVYVAQTVVSDERYQRRLLRLEAGGGEEAPVVFALRPGGAVEAAGAAPPAPAHGFAPDGDGGLVVEAPWPGDPFRRLVRRYDAAGRLAAQWTVDSPSVLRTAEVLGRDPLGGVVLLLNPGHPDGRLVRLGAGGLPEFARPFPWRSEYPMTAFGRMDARGNLYVAVPDDRGWHLLRLRLRAPWRVVSSRPPGQGAPGPP